MQSDDGERNKGAGLPSGKILKGTLNEAPLKVKVSSIPTRFENIVYVNHGQSAFGNSQRRFFSPGEEDLSCAVGPGRRLLTQESIMRMCNSAT